MRQIALDVANGIGSFDFKDRNFGNIMWPVEEILFLKLINSDIWVQIEKFLRSNYASVPQDLIPELISFQRVFVKQPRMESGTKFEFEYDLFDYVSNLLLNNEVPLKKRSNVLHVEDHVEFSNLQDFAREVVWYGRKGSSLRSRLGYAK
jgi:hypothetical protein